MSKLKVQMKSKIKSSKFQSSPNVKAQWLGKSKCQNPKFK